MGLAADVNETFVQSRQRDAETIKELQQKLCDVTYRAETAEARVRELERIITKRAE